MVFVQPDKLKSIKPQFVHTNTVSRDVTIIVITCIERCFSNSESCLLRWSRAEDVKAWGGGLDFL